MREPMSCRFINPSGMLAEHFTKWDCVKIERELEKINV